MPKAHLRYQHLTLIMCCFENDSGLLYSMKYFPSTRKNCCTQEESFEMNLLVTYVTQQAAIASQGG